MLCSEIPGLFLLKSHKDTGDRGHVWVICPCSPCSSALVESRRTWAGVQKGCQSLSMHKSCAGDAVLGAAHVPSSPRSLLTLTLQAAVSEPGAAGSQLMSLHKAAPLI